MHILYHQKSIHNAGGIERILLDKAGRFAADGIDVTIVTTDSPPPGAAQFFPIPEGVKVVHLDINYILDNSLPLIKRIISHFRKKRLHRSRLESILSELQPDIVITIHPTLSSFVPKLKDGSRKWVELHFTRHFRRLANRRGLSGLIDRVRDIADKYHLKKFDKVITLTEQDRQAWGEMPNLYVIPNYTKSPELTSAPAESKRVIAVGRLCPQKNFGLLLDAWALVMKHPQSEGWKLTIYGDGPERFLLEQKIKHYNLQDSVEIAGNTPDITRRMSESAILIATSQYEGFSMSILEGMATGLPVVSTNCESGPRELIENESTGILTSFSADEIANAVIRLISDPALRRDWGHNSRQKIISEFSPERIINRWENYFING